MGDHVRQRRLRSVVRVLTAGVHVRVRAQLCVRARACACATVLHVRVRARTQMLVKSREVIVFRAGFMILDLGDISTLV